MIIFKRASDLQDYVQGQKLSGVKIGFVPTMGALHEGHISLLHQCVEENEISICSIFVNPTQFNNPDDFKQYPVTIEKDIELLTVAGCNALFLPSVAEVYPEYNEKKQYDLGELETLLEGKFRPGHFQGVCQVVDRFLSLVQPGRLYMGQKDYQQCMVIKKMLDQEYNGAIKLITVATKREESGLAMSSRNLRLSEEQKAKATLIYKTLIFIKENFDQTEPAILIKEATKNLTENGFDVDYVAIVNRETLRPIIDKKEPTISLIAAAINNVRLIDNLVLN